MLTVKADAVLKVAMFYRLLISNFPIQCKSSVKLRLWRFCQLYLKIY
jgi:hypothetical protein